MSSGEVEATKMIDKNKWDSASDDVKMQAIRAIKELVREESVSKADNALITEFLLRKVDENFE